MNKRQQKKFKRQTCEWGVRALCPSPKKDEVVVFQIPFVMIEDQWRMFELKSILKKLFPRNQVLLLSDEIKISTVPKDQLLNLHIPPLPKEREDELSMRRNILSKRKSDKGPTLSDFGQN